MGVLVVTFNTLDNELRGKIIILPLNYKIRIINYDVSSKYIDLE